MVKDEHYPCAGFKVTQNRSWAPLTVSSQPLANDWVAVFPRRALAFLKTIEIQTIMSRNGSQAQNGGLGSLGPHRKALDEIVQLVNLVQGQGAKLQAQSFPAGWFGCRLACNINGLDLDHGNLGDAKGTAEDENVQFAGLAKVIAGVIVTKGHAIQTDVHNRTDFGRGNHGKCPPFHL